MLRKINLNYAGIILSFVFFLIPLQSTYADYDSFTVNVPNAQGGYTALVIKKSGNGYVGPQGEFYSQFPSVYQLQITYGLTSPNPTVVPVTYQVINQAPYQESDEDYDDRPVIQPNITEVINSSNPNENENDWAFFELKKKKKSQQPPTDNHNVPKSSPPSDKGKPQEVKNPSQGASTGKDQKKKAEQTVPQNKAGTGS